MSLNLYILSKNATFKHTKILKCLSIRLIRYVASSITLPLIMVLTVSQDLRQAKDHEFSAVKEEMKQQTEKINALMQELLKMKTSQEQVTKDKESLQVKML